MDLWTEASADVEGERLALRLARAKVAVAGLWPFLALAQSESEFEHRMALANDHIANVVPVDLLTPISDSLREDFRAVAAKDAEGEEEADDEDGDGKPDWLQEKIDSKKSSLGYWHAGLGRWVAFDDDAGDNSAPDPIELMTGPKSTSAAPTEDDDSEESASWKDLGERGPSHEGRRTTAYWHAGAQRWVTAAIDETPGGGNPYYFTGGPEAGPNTGQTNQFAPHPTGQDPVDPLNVQYPLNPSPWTVPPGGEWKEQPMNFNPPAPRTAVYHVARDTQPVGATTTCDNCTNPMKKINTSWGKTWTHTGPHGAEADDQCPGVPKTALRAHGEGVAGGPGPNPNFFGSGAEGVAGDQGAAFPPDLARGVDPEDWVNEAYGPQPMSAGNVDNGNHVAFRRRADATPDRPAPDSDKLMGTEFDSSQERERWNTAEDPEAQQGSRASFSASRFYDPADPSIRFTAGAMDEFMQAGQPGSSTPATPAGPGGGDSTAQATEMMDALNSKIGPATTKPRQMPGGSTSDMAAKDPAMQAAARMRRQGEGTNRARPTSGNPYGTDDPFDAKTWDNATKQRPMLGLEHMNFNGPQNPNAREHIRTTTSPGPEAEEDDEDEGRREASLVAEWAVRGLVGAR